ncbi:MAG: hypothetical protein RR623_01315 [Bacilli bacterium]
MSKQAFLKTEDKTYVIDSFRGLKGMKLLTRVSKYIFPFVSFMGNQNLEDDFIINELSTLLDGDNADKVSDLIVELVQEVTVDGMKLNFDTEFECNYDVLFKLVYEVLKLNYFESFQKLVTNLNQK